MFLVPGNETDGKLSKSIFYLGVQFIHITVKHCVGTALVPSPCTVREGKLQWIMYHVRMGDRFIRPIVRHYILNYLFPVVGEQEVNNGEEIYFVC